MKATKRVIVLFITACLLIVTFAGSVLADGKTGWIYENGWKYYESDENYKTGWFKDKGEWYYLGEEDGIMYSNGAFNINNKLYFFKKNGTWVGKEGWQKAKYTEDGQSYSYWFYVNSKGRAQTGWKKIKGTWYMFNNEGVMAQNCGENDPNNGKAYLFDKNGAWVSTPGWNKVYYDDGAYAWYYLKPNGEAQTGWKKINGTWYYFYEWGRMCNDGAIDTAKDKIYYFNLNGKLRTKEGWVKETYQYEGETYVYWYYVKSNGRVKTGWFKDKGKWYYGSEYGYIYMDGTYEINGKDYKFNKSGAWVK